MLPTYNFNSINIMNIPTRVYNIQYFDFFNYHSHLVNFVQSYLNNINHTLWLYVDLYVIIYIYKTTSRNVYIIYVLTISNNRISLTSTYLVAQINLCTRNTFVDELDLLVKSLNFMNINSINQELQLSASNRHITIISTGGSCSL